MAKRVSFSAGDSGGCSDRPLIKLCRKDSSFLEPLIIGLVSSEHDMGDVFFGSDDARDMKEVQNKEDVLESYRRKKEIKDLKRKEKGRSFIRKLIDLLKVIFCFKL